MLNEKKKVLVVDDDPVLVKMMEGLLEKAGHIPLITTEAAVGLQSALDHSPDLIVLDVMMPIINGYNFCRLLKSEEGTREIPVIFLTSRDEEDDVAIGKEMGGDAYFTKPVDTNALMIKINELIKS